MLVYTKYIISLVSFYDKKIGVDKELEIRERISK